MKKLLLVLNPNSGKRKAGKLLPQIRDIFESAGYHATVHITTGPGDCTREVARQAQAMDLVVCCGGDGTFNEAVNGLLQCRAATPLGYIPAGSTNDFAASLHLSTDLLEAARDIVSGTVRAYDIGQVNGTCVSYVLSFGAFTRTSYATSQKLKNRLGFLAYLLSGIGELFRLRALPMEAEVAGETLDGRFLFGAVSNSYRMGGVLRLDPNRVCMDDGKLELLLIRACKNPFRLLSCLWNLKKQRYDHPLVEFRTAEQFRFRCPPGTVWTVDGERYDPPSELTVQALPRAISIVQKG